MVTKATAGGTSLPRFYYEGRPDSSLSNQIEMGQRVKSLPVLFVPIHVIQKKLAVGPLTRPLEHVKCV